MPILILAARTSVAPYAAVLAFGFALGLLGQINHSRVMAVTGVLIVLALSSYLALRVAVF